MSGTLSASLQAAMKEVVIDQVFTAFQQDDSMFNYFDMGGGGDVEVNDRGARWIQYVRPNPSGSALSEAGPLAVPGTSTQVAQTCRFTEYSMSAAYSGTALRQMEQRNTLVDGMAGYMNRDRKTLRVNFSQDLFENGSGMKAIYNGTVSGTTVTTYTTVAGGSTYGVQRLLVNGRYNFVNPATGLIRAGGGTSVCVVSSLAQSAAQATFDAVPNDIADGDYIVRENSYNKIVRGLSYAIASNSLARYGVSCADYPELNSNVKDVNGSNFSFTIGRLMDHIMAVSRDEEGMVDIFVGIPQFQAMEEVFHPLVRLNNGEKTGKIGLERFELGGKTVVRERWCQDANMWYVNKGTWKKLFLQGISLWEEDGKVLRPEPWVSATGSGTSLSGAYKDNWLLSYVFRGDIICTSARDNGLIKNLGLPSHLVRPFQFAR